MGKGHRDNHTARIKRGKSAFDKKAKRRAHVPRCPVCGNEARDLALGMCVGCQRQQQGLNRDGSSKTVG